MAEREMTGIEALEELTKMINREKHINSSWNAKINNLKDIVLKSLNRQEQLEIANKNNEGLVRENVNLINRNLKLQDELKRCQDTIKKWTNNHKKLIIENGKMKRIIKENFSVYDDEVILVGYYPILEEEIKEVLQDE